MPALIIILLIIMLRGCAAQNKQTASIASPKTKITQGDNSSAVNQSGIVNLNVKIQDLEKKLADARQLAEHNATPFWMILAGGAGAYLAMHHGRRGVNRVWRSRQARPRP